MKRFLSTTAAIGALMFAANSYGSSNIQSASNVKVSGSGPNFVENGGLTKNPCGLITSCQRDNCPQKTQTRDTSKDRADKRGS